jgi:hypothetical protein
MPGWHRCRGRHLRPLRAGVVWSGGCLRRLPDRNLHSVDGRDTMRDVRTGVLRARLALHDLRPVHPGQGWPWMRAVSRGPLRHGILVQGVQGVRSGALHTTARSQVTRRMPELRGGYLLGQGGLHEMSG